MKRIFSLFAALCAASSAAAEDPPAPQQLVLSNVTIIDVTAPPGRALTPGRTIVIAGHKIAQIRAFDPADHFDGAVVVDGEGKFVVPGLWDMHTHPNREAIIAERVMGPLMIANGVTGQRVMLGDCWDDRCGPTLKPISEMRKLQERIERGEVVSARIIALSSDLIHGPTEGTGDAKDDVPPFRRPATEEDGRRLARYLKERGVDIAKTYQSIPRVAFFGLTDEAKKLGLRVSGHLPWSVTMIEAAEAGMTSIEHARFPGLACGGGWEAFRKEFAAFAEGRRKEFPEALFRGLFETTIEKYDEKQCRKIFAALAANNTYLDPTFPTRKMDAFADDFAYRQDPRLQYVPWYRYLSWVSDLDNTANGPPERRAFYRAFYDHALKLAGRAHEAGVKFLAGTDVFDTMTFPGFSLHDELGNFVAAGFSPLESLKTATINAAEFMEMDDAFGSVAEGKTADLVLLNADPLADIANTKDIAAVVFDGRLYDREALDGLLAGAGETVRNQAVKAYMTSIADEGEADE